ncbi:MAG: T9SS type A sorting domain-containing protein [Bacteroidota bacterium]
MRRIATLFMLLFVALGLSFQANAQRYLTEVFDEVSVEADITYGVNATILQIGTAGELLPEELKMDIYTPVGDTETERPLALVFHTGNFLPPVTNGQISGLRTDSSVVEICTRLAKYGYTAASVSYRLGWNPLAATQPERALGLIQASYRGIQDGRTAIRYFKNDVINGDNQYSIDTSAIACIGTGTGGYITLGMATVNNYNEIPTAMNPPGKFLLDTDGDGVPETPMVVPTYHGDIEGKNLTIAPDAAFGFPGGDTSNYVNYPGISSEYQLSVNVGGALGDISWLDEETPPLITIQSAFDFFAPYEDAVLVVPTTGDPIVQVQGGLVIHTEQDALGNNQVFIDANINDDFTTTAIGNSANADHDYFEALYPYTRPENSNGEDEGVAIEWWDPGAPAPGAGMGIPWNMLPHPSGLTFHENGLLLNEGMSAEKARTNIDTIMGYYAPRAVAAMGLEVTSVEELEEQMVALTLAPNPVGNEVLLTSAPDFPMKNVVLFDQNGQVLRTFNNLDTNYFFMSRGDLPSGMYIMQIGFEEGQSISKKLIFN